MWFDNTKCTVIKDSCSFHASFRFSSTEKEIWFSFSWFTWVWSMGCILSSVCTEECSEWFWSLLLCSLCVSWSNKASPFSYGIISYKVHSNDNITLHMSTKIIKKSFAYMFSIKLIYGVIIKLGHLKLINFKAIFLNGINNLSEISIGIWFYHCKSATTILWKLVSCSTITIFFNM